MNVIRGEIAEDENSVEICKLLDFQDKITIHITNIPKGARVFIETMDVAVQNKTIGSLDNELIFNSIVDDGDLKIFDTPLKHKFFTLRIRDGGHKSFEGMFASDTLKLDCANHMIIDQNFS